PMPNCILQMSSGLTSEKNISWKRWKIIQKEKEDTAKRENKSKQNSRRDMRKRVIMRNLYAILFLISGGIIFAQEDSLQIVKDSVVIDTVQSLPEPTQDITQAGYTNPQTYMLADLEVSGETKFTKNQVMRFVGLRLGEK